MVLLLLIMLEQASPVQPGLSITLHLAEETIGLTITALSHAGTLFLTEECFAHYYSKTSFSTKAFPCVV